MVCRVSGRMKESPLDKVPASVIWENTAEGRSAHRSWGKGFCKRPTGKQRYPACTGSTSLVCQRATVTVTSSACSGFLPRSERQTGARPHMTSSWQGFHSDNTETGSQWRALSTQCSDEMCVSGRNRLVRLSGRAFAYQKGSCIWHPGPRGAESWKSVMWKQSSFLLFSVGNSHVYQHGKCTKKAAQEERETKNEEPPRERK